MDEEAEIGYLFPTSNVEQTNLEIKVLTKKCVLFIQIFHFESTIAEIVTHKLHINANFSS